MSITFPLSTLFTEHTIKTGTFTLKSRQEFSRTAGGALIAKDFSRAIWAAAFQSVSMNYDDATDLEALLQSLDGSVNTFVAHDTRRPYPRKYSTGQFNDDGVIGAINANRKALTVTGLDANFQLRRGDMLSFEHVTGGKSLHVISENVNADPSGDTPEFEVRPHLPVEAIATMAVSFKVPSCLMLIEPDSVEYTEGASTLGVVAFRGVQYL